MFNIIMQQRISLGSYEFFNVLGVVQKLLLVMPSPDYTAMIGMQYLL